MIQARETQREKHGLDRVHSVPGNFGGFVHPELEIEFLTPEIGTGEIVPYRFEGLRIPAQGLKYKTSARRFKNAVEYRGRLLWVPEPAAYGLSVSDSIGPRVLRSQTRG